MRWRGGRQSGNIEDRRGLGPVGAVGGLGLGGVVIILIGVFVFGVDPQQMISAVSDGGVATQPQQAGVRGATTDEGGRFVGAVETSTTDVWSDIFRQSGATYTPTAGVVLYDLRVPSRSVLAITVTLVLASACFSALGLALAMALPTMQLTVAVSNGIVIPLAFVSDMFMVTGQMPGWLATIGITSKTQLYDPRVNAYAAFVLYQRSGSFAPWQ